MADVVIVLPCYNEEMRLQDAPVLSILRDPDVNLLLVDDGSSDDTEARLRSLQHRAPDRIEVLALPANWGKAEAVRAGMQHAVASGAEYVGFADADLATPPEEILRLVTTLRAAPEVNAVLGSRVAVLGADIDRTRMRYYLGRVFAAFASMIVRAPVYDTQCGAKVFRRTVALENAIARPFRSRWAFDIELLGRLIVHAGDYRGAGIIEIPLRRWEDVSGSKLRPTHMLKACLDLAGIAVELSRLRRGQSS
jgi:dolichyl-phosphate beta-glucosyltransferase